MVDLDIQYRHLRSDWVSSFASRLRNALSIPEILGAIQHLEMPVSAAWAMICLWLLQFANWNMAQEKPYQTI